MLIEDEMKTIYLNYRIKEIVPFLIKLTPKEKKETTVIVKKFLDKDWGYNDVSMPAFLSCSSNCDEYRKWASTYYTMWVNFGDKLFESYAPEWMGSCFNSKLSIRKKYKGNVAEEIPELMSENKEIPVESPLLDYLFNAYHGTYDHHLIHVLYTVPRVLRFVFAKKCNETLANTVYQYDSETNTEFLNVRMRLDLPFQLMHYLFKFAYICSKGKTFSGTAFEAIIYKIVSVDFDIGTLGIMISEKINFRLVSVKRLLDKLFGFMSLSFSHHRSFEKLLISILTAIDYPVFKLKNVLGIYYERLHLNHSKIDYAVAGRLKE